MGDVIEFDIPTLLDLPPERILDGAKTADLDSAIVVGWDTNGELYFASSIGSLPDMLYLIECAKMRVMEMSYADR